MLAMVGIYGVISFSVNERTQEIGIRMALGARAADVLKMVLAQGMRVALVGIVIGLGAAFALTRLLSSLLFEVSPTDLRTFSHRRGVCWARLLSSRVTSRRGARRKSIRWWRSDTSES